MLGTEVLEEVQNYKSEREISFRALLTRGGDERVEAGHTGGKIVLRVG